MHAKIDNQDNHIGDNHDNYDNHDYRMPKDEQDWSVSMNGVHQD
jgi:hypothetical protein